MDMRKAISLTTLLFVCAFDDKLENEGHEVELFELPSWISECSSKILVNVDGPAAVGDRISDDTQLWKPRQGGNSIGIVTEVAVDTAHSFLAGLLKVLDLSNETWQEASGLCPRTTSKLPEPMQFACSDKDPCTLLFRNNINLGRMDVTAETCCSIGTGFGYICATPQMPTEIAH